MDIHPNTCILIITQIECKRILVLLITHKPKRVPATWLITGTNILMRCCKISIFLLKFVSELFFQQLQSGTRMIYSATLTKYSLFPNPEPHVLGAQYSFFIHVHDIACSLFKNTLDAIMQSIDSLLGTDAVEYTGACEFQTPGWVDLQTFKNYDLHHCKLVHLNILYNERKWSASVIILPVLKRVQSSSMRYNTLWWWAIKKICSKNGVNMRDSLTVAWPFSQILISVYGWLKNVNSQILSLWCPLQEKILFLSNIVHLVRCVFVGRKEQKFEHTCMKNVRTILGYITDGRLLKERICVPVFFWISRMDAPFGPMINPETSRVTLTTTLNPHQLLHSENDYSRKKCGVNYRIVTGSEALCNAPVRSSSINGNNTLNGVFCSLAWSSWPWIATKSSKKSCLSLMNYS